MRIATSMIVDICYGLEREGWGFQCLNLVFLKFQCLVLSRWSIRVFAALAGVTKLYC